jgi:hypothetical protein
MMKRLSSIITIALIVLVTLGAAAKTPKAEDCAIPFDKLVNVIASSGHWSEENLSAIGLAKVVSRTAQEEFGESTTYVYGQNVKCRITEDWEVNLSAKGLHAFAIVVTLMTDNSTELYFMEKADHDAFMECVRQSSEYRQDEGSEYNEEFLGENYIQSDEYRNGWYVVTFHVG